MSLKEFSERLPNLWGAFFQMDIPQAQLDQALRMVQRGEMQPDEAARWLLKNSTHNLPRLPVSTFEPRSVAELMRDLGTPPLDIQRDWDQQVAQLGQSFLRNFGFPLTELSASDLLIDSHNRLSLSPVFIERFAARGQSDRIEQTWQAESASSPSHSPSSQRLKGKPAKETMPDNGSSVPSAQKSSGFFARRQRLVSLLTYGGAFGLMGLTLYLLLPKADSEIAKDMNRATTSQKPSAKPTSIFSPTAERSAGFAPPESPESEFESVPLEMIEGPTEPAKQSDESRATMGLDSFAGGNWASASELLPEASFDASTIEPSESEDSSSDGMALEDAPRDELSINDGSSPALDGDESASMASDAPDSPTRMVQGSTSVVLPPIPSKVMVEQGVESVVLTEQKPNGLEVAFPMECGLTIAKEDQQWMVKDAKDQTSVGLFAIEETGLHFRWTENAVSRSVAKQLACGMMQLSAEDGVTTNIYLRPVVNATLWPIDVTGGDAKAAWPIGVSPPLGPSKLDIRFQLPPTMLQTWVQPYEPSKIRRCQSIAEFSLIADPTIAVRSRIDVRVGTRITIRVRHAAQLDKEFPWQMISINRIQSAASQVGLQLARASSEQTELKSLYSNVGASEKRVIAARREMVDLAVSKLQSLSDRLTRYESLLTQLQQNSYLDLQLAVDWPEGVGSASQTIFAMTPQVETKPESQGPAK